MNLFLRCICVLIKTFWRPRLSITGVSSLDFRVLPNDLDIYGHMNNGRYLTIMDLGRMDLILRTGLMRQSLRRKWKPLVALSMMKYRRSLCAFESYELQTRILCWTEKWFFIEQVFLSRGRKVAEGWVKGLFYGKKGGVRTGEVVESLGQPPQSPPMPMSLASWQKLETTHLRDGGHHG